MCVGVVCMCVCVCEREDKKGERELLNNNICRPPENKNYHDRASAAKCREAAGSCRLV